MAYGARLESVLGASPRGFESPILRRHPGIRVIPGFFCTPLHCSQEVTRQALLPIDAASRSCHDDPMRTNIPSLIALPMALLLAVSLSACDEEAVGSPSTRPSSSATADPTDSPKDEPSRGSDATPSATPQADASASSSAKAEGEAKTVSIQDLKTGNCISEMVNGTEQGGTDATGAKLVDCSTPHQYEVTGTGQSTASTYAEASTSDEVTAVCNPVLEKYVGSSSKAKKYRVAALTPSQSSWDQGDHSLVCFAQNRDNTPLNNSIKNS